MSTATSAPATSPPAEPAAAGSNGKALATVASAGGLSVYSRITDPMEFIGKMGVTIYNSKMFGCVNADQGRMLAFMFLVRGVDPFSWKARNHIIGGNVSMAAEAMLADLRTDLGGSHKIVSRTPEKAAIEITLGKQRQLFEFTWSEAQQEDYVYTSDANKNPKTKRLADGSINPAALKDNWSTPRRRMQMLWARVVSDAVGAIAPEIAGGKLTPEELGVLSADATAQEASTTEPPANEPAAESDPTVIDGEFEVLQQPAGTEEASGSTSSSVANPIPGDAQPAVASTEPAAQTKTATGRAKPTGRQAELLRRLKPLKDALMTPEKYEEVLDKKGVKSAADLDLDALEKMVLGLEKRKREADERAELKAHIDKSLEPKPQAAGTDAVSQWAEGAAKPQAAEGHAGN